MAVETIESDFKHRVCDQLRLEEEGLNRYRVLTPFMFEDGDHLSIALRKEADAWVLSDEGNTFMHLTYDLDERDLQQGTRQKIIANALSAFGVRDRDGELVLTIPDEEYGNALYNFVQALLRITDVTYLSREQVRSTFVEDFRSLIEQHVPEVNRTFNWHDAQRDPDGNYPVDCRVNGSSPPTFVYALSNDDKVQVATIALHQFERWNLSFRSIGIFESQEEINRKVLARFSDVCENQFSTLAGNQDRIVRYLTGPTQQRSA